MGLDTLAGLPLDAAAQHRWASYDRVATVRVPLVLQWPAGILFVTNQILMW